MRYRLFLIKLQPKGLQLCCKKTESVVFSCEHKETFKKTYFEEHKQKNASKTRNINPIISKMILAQINLKTFDNTYKF